MAFAGDAELTFSTWMKQGERDRKRVKSTDELEPADVVAFPRGGTGDPGTALYWHFAVVEKLNPTRNTFGVIHFQAGYGGAAELQNKAEATIARETIDFSKEEYVYVLIFAPAMCFDPDEVLERARSRLGEKEYNLIINNCEHFAFWCKTGLSQSTQVVDTVMGGVNALLGYLKKK